MRKYLGQLLPVDRVKTTRLYNGTHLPRAKEELAEEADFQR